MANCFSLFGTPSTFMVPNVDLIVMIIIIDFRSGRPTEIAERDVFLCQSRYDEGDGTIRKMKVIKVYNF